MLAKPETAELEAWRLLTEAEVSMSEAGQQAARVAAAIRPALQRALEVDRAYAEGWAALGHLEVLAGRPAAAVLALGAALEREPGLVDANVEMGLALDEIRNQADAEAFLREGIRRNPANAEAYGQLERVLYNGGKRNELQLVASAGLASEFPAVMEEAGETYSTLVGERGTWLSHLTIALSSKWVRTRRWASKSLRTFGDHGTIPALIRALRDSDETVRFHAARAMEAIPDKRATSTLVATLRDSSTGVRRSAARALGAIGDRGAVPALIEGLRSGGAVAESVEHALSLIGDASSTSLLLPLLDAPAAELRLRVLRVLEELEDKAAGPRVLRMLDDADPEVRLRAIRALRTVGGATAVPRLAAALNDADPEVRRIAAYSLEAVGDERAVPSLLARLSDPDPSVRRAAAAACGKIGDGRCTPALVSLLSDPTYEARSGALDGIAALKPSSALRDVQKALRSDGHWLIREKAVVALAALGDQTSVAALIGALKDPHVIVRSEAAKALGRLDARSAVPALSPLLKDADADLRFDVAEVLGEWGDPKGIEYLTKILDGAREVAPEKDRVTGFMELIKSELAKGPLSEPTFVEALYRYRHLDHDEGAAAEVLAAAGQVDILSARFRRIHNVSNDRILGVMRKRALFPRNFDQMTGSGDRRLQSSGHYLKALKAREEGRHQEQLAESNEAIRLAPVSDSAGLSVLSLWLKAQAELKLGLADDATRTITAAEGQLNRVSRADETLFGELFESYTQYLKGEVLSVAGQGKQARVAYEDALDGVKRRKREPEWRETAQRLENMVLTGLGGLEARQAKEHLALAVEGGRALPASDSVEMESEERRYVELARQRIAEGAYEEAHGLLEELTLRRAQYVNRRIRISLADPEKEAYLVEYRRRIREIDSLTLSLAGLRDSGHEVKGQLPPGDSSSEIRRLEDARSDRRRSLLKYLTEVRRRHPDVAALMAAKPIELARIQERLPADTVVLQYLLLPEKIVVFVLKSGGIEVVETAFSKAKLGELVATFRRQVLDGSAPATSADLARLSAELHRVLLRPVEEARKLEGVRVLGIAPNGFLHHLPFPALANESGQYLVDRYSLFFVSSTSLLGVAFDREREKGRGASSLLALSNPDGSLPGADREVAGIQSGFIRPDIHSGPDARKTWIKSRAGTFTNLHLATHGVLDPADSTRSHLAFADGKLSVEEIWALPLRGVRLTVLSACDTALGELLSGDDVVSLENAFVYAGSPAMVATLWKVADTSTAELMSRFYANMLGKDPMSKSEALTRAQRWLKERHPAPYFWAGFALHGDWE
jgi:CHAT domain-containing protein/HEAT repeat protein